MRRLISVLLLLLSSFTLIACSKINQQNLDGEYYWISTERNELAFTINGSKGNIQHGEADSFAINKENSTFELSGTNITDSTVKYQYKDGTIRVNLSGVERDYYQKGSKAYEESIQKNGYTK